MNERQLLELAEAYGLSPWQQAAVRGLYVKVEKEDMNQNLKGEEKMLTVTVATLDGTIERIEVLNQGHPETGDWPQDDDLRKYRWRTVGRAKEGHVEHHRDEGALVLAQIVLSAVNAR